jgi:hypothetical protein
MKVHFGNMWSVFTSVDLFCITTNSITRKDGELVMGRGIAQQARDRYPGLGLALGNAISDAGMHGEVYGLLVSPSWPIKKLAAFQVKVNWQASADLNIIRESARALYKFAKANPDKTIALNFPGIGYGKLDYNDVLEIVKHLPDNVQLWKFSK